MTSPGMLVAPTAEWVKGFEAVSVAAGPIYEFDEVFANPQARHLGLHAEIERPAAAGAIQLGSSG